MAAGTKIADVYIDAKLELTEYNKGLKQAAANATQVGQDIRNALKGQATSGSAGLAGFIEDLKLGGGLSVALRNNFKGMASDLRTLSVSGLTTGLHTLEGVGQQVFGHLKSLAGEVVKGFALGAGILGFLSLERVIEKLTSAIPELVNRGKEFAESVHTLTIETGATSEKASGLLAVYQFLGGTATDLNQKVNRLATTIHTNEAAFNALGVQTRDSNGNLLDQITIVDNLRRAFATLPEGPVKTELALRSFGRNGATALGPLLHYLNLTDEQVKQLTEDAQKQGLILSESQLTSADAVGKAQARIQNAITGLAVTLFTEVGPKLASFFDGVADFITANAQRISDAISGIVAQIIGLVQGLLGINLGSFSAQFSNVAEGGSQWAGAIVDDTKALADLQGQLKPATDGVTAHNAAIDKQIKGLEGASKAADRNAKAQTDALDRENAAIDRQIDKIKHLGDVQDTVYRRDVANLTRQYDAELALLDAEDQRIARAEQAQADSHNETQAARDLERAKRGLADAQVDLANAQAQYNEDLADPKADPKKLAQDYLAIADAQQKVRDAQQGIADAQAGITDAQQQTADHARANAEEDRRAQIAAVKAYVDSISKIVEDSENKKAALTTLKAREQKLLEEQELARQKGNAQEVADLQTKIDAVRLGEGDLGKQIKNQQDIDALNARKKLIEAEKQQIADLLQARKDELAGEVSALQESKQNQTAVSKAALNKQIVDLKAKIEEDKKHLAEEAAAHKQLQDQIDQGLISTAGTADTVLDPAFERARLAGIKMADDIKGAINGLMDVLFGAEGPTVYRGGGTAAPGPRTGGLVGGLSGLVGIFATVATGVKDILTGMAQFKAKDIALGVVAAGVYFKALPVIVAGLVLYGGADILSRAGQVVQNPNGSSTIPNLIPGLPGFNFATPGKADGGPVTGGQVYRVNERGIPEYFRPSSSGVVYPLISQAAPALIGASATPGEWHVHVHVPWDNRAIDFIANELAYRRRS